MPRISLAIWDAMPDSFPITSGALVAFLLVLARMGGVFTFLPIPGAQNAPVLARIVCALGFTIALHSSWPAVSLVPISAGAIVWWLAGESVLGVASGLIVLFVSEAFTVAAQMISLQAGYSYATTIDPASQVDASLLPILWQMLTGLLFFSTGIDRYLIRTLAESLSQCPPSRCTVFSASALEVIHAGQQMLLLGLRIALPVIVLLLLVDISLAFVSRVSAQLQLLSLAFPIKLMGALFLFALLMPLAAGLYRSSVEQLAPLLNHLLH